MPTYQTFKAVLKPQTAFISPLVGDMLFGQLCATLAQIHGSEKIATLLQGYTEGEPFAVISDGFPAIISDGFLEGYLPKPRLPVAILEALSHNLKVTDPTQRKAAKKKSWIPTSKLVKNIDLIALWESAAELPEAVAAKSASETHNSINRLTGTTGEDGFAPYTIQAQWYSDKSDTLPVYLEVYCVVDTARFSQKELHSVLTNIGQWGYGKDATVGKGKFEVVSLAPCNLLNGIGQHYWTLAACAPQGLGFDELNSYYVPTTRYPRHGGETVHISPYKTPLLLADTAAVFTLKEIDTKTRSFIGQGLGGVNQQISSAKPETVHQGYAPCICFTVSNADVLKRK